MKIEQGLMAGQVLQRDAKNYAAVRIEGTCPGKGRVEARFRKGKSPLRGGGWTRIGTAAAGRFKGRLTGIPCGGPYTIEVRIMEGTRCLDQDQIKDVWVGDVWFMGGQSNMQGVGLMDTAPKPHPLVRCFYMRDEWGQACEPLHLLGEAVDPVHNNGQRLTVEQAEQARKTAIRGVGPGLFFGIEMARRTGVPQGLVACAHGGTSMAAWSPALKDQEGKSLYGAMLRRYHKLGQPIRGMLWYQGESDAFPEQALVYTQRMQELVASVRRDFNQPRLPWLIVQIGRVFSETWSAVPWNEIQNQQRLLPACIKNLEVVPAVDLELHDMIHIGTAGHAILARRLADMADRMALGLVKKPGSIRLRKIREIHRKNPGDPLEYGIELSFDHVVGSLQSQGLPHGFTLLDSSSKPLSMIYRVRLEGNKVILETTLTPALAFKIGYGLGTGPHCNITDARGMALPVFGPVFIAGHQGIGSAFLVEWRISGPYPGLTVESAAYPDPQREWRAPYSVATHLIMAQDVRNPKPGLFYYRTTLQVEREMQTQLSLGADSPYRIWINGQDVACDLKATNPCYPDKSAHSVRLSAGRNEIVVAFDGRNGGGWGICMRFLPASSREAFAPDAMVECKESSPGSDAGVETK